jgi:gliding motility-associated-like protein
MFDRSEGLPNGLNAVPVLHSTRAILSTFRSTFGRSMGHVLRVAFWFWFLPVMYFLPCSGTAQELVPDGGFETLDLCPVPGGFGELENLSHWYLLQGTCDLYQCGIGIPNNAFGQQWPSQGLGYIGCGVGELPATRLNAPLQAGRAYQVSFKCSFASGLGASTMLGVHFSRDSLCRDGGPWWPQIKHTGTPVLDSANWTQVSGIYVATGCELYMTLVHEGGPWSYYYFDDVSVTCADPLGCLPGACLDSTTLQIPNIFTPNGDGFNDTFQFQTALIEQPFYSYRIYNRWGSIVVEGDFSTGFWDGSLDGRISPEGVYYYIVRSKTRPCSEVIEQKGFVHLIR